MSAARRAARGRRRPTMQAARRRLAVLWLGAGGLSALVLVAMSIRALEGRQAEVWGWFLPTVLPTASLVLATLGLAARGALPAGLADERPADPFLFRLAYGISAFYLALVFFAIVGWQLGPHEDPVDALAISNLWLGPLQGLAASAVGWFFLTASDGGDGEKSGGGDEG